MFRPTRLISAVSTLWAQLNTRLQLTRENISFHLFCLVGGFFLGNIFGTFLNVLRGIFHWDGLIILSFIFLCEFISFQTYRPIAEAKTRATPIRAQESVSILSWRPLNLIKLGLLFGFFVDAFKVGS
jgi:hypothetical protein